MLDEKRRSVAFVIPALNERATIQQVIAGLRSFGDVIVVDDGSVDNTGSLARDCGAVVVSHSNRRGYDKAILSGLVAAMEMVGVDWVITMDADGQHDPASLPQILHLIAGDQVDFVAGCRSDFPRLSERVIAGYYYRRWRVPDPLCGLKAYRINCLRRVNFDVVSDIDTVGTAAMLAVLARGARHLSVPVQIRARAGKPRFGSLISANLRIFKLLVQTPRIWKAFQFK